MLTDSCSFVLTLTAQVDTSRAFLNQFLARFGLGGLGDVAFNLIAAIAVLILGWIISAFVANIVRNLLKRTNLDNRLFSSLGTSQAEVPGKLENIIASIVFWLLMLMTMVGFLNILQLTAVATPLNGFLEQIFIFLPRLGSAGLLIALAWVVATIARAAVVRTSRSFGLDNRLNEVSSDNQFLLSDTLGNALYWFVFLFFLPLVLDVLHLQGPLAPVQNLLNEILAALPKILKALLIAGVGWLIARVVREIVTNLLVATGVDRIGSQFGLRTTTGAKTLSWLLGTVVYVLILLPTVIAALDALQIEAISGPATSMLNQILTTIPQIFTAVVILVLAYGFGRFVADLVVNILTSLGFNNLLSWLGFRNNTFTTTVAQNDLEIRQRTPSEVVGIVVMVGIMLFATVASTNVLNIPALTEIVRELLTIFGRLLAGLIVFGVGLYLANLAFTLILSSDNRQTRLFAQVARIAIIALVSAMALQQMGIASSIVNLAFGLLLGAIAFALALAFGLGGRETANRQLQEWLDNFKNNQPPS